MTTRLENPDLIVLAKRCYPRAKKQPPTEALAIQAGRIIALGRGREIRALRKRSTRVLDLGEAVVTPGLVDCHTHFFYWALHRALTIDVSDCRSLATTQQRIKQRARTRSVGDWIVALGFDYNSWPEGIPAARDLDLVVPDRPAIVYSRDIHTAWLNSAAMRQIGITARTPDPAGGRFSRDERGRPTGIAQETAVDLLPDPVWKLAERDDPAATRLVDRALEQAYRAAWSLGLVGVHTMDGPASLRHLQRHRGRGDLGVRVVHAVRRENLDEAIKLGLRSGLGDRWLRLGGVKIFADGALGSQTARMFKPYPGSSDNCGLSMIGREELTDVAATAVRNGWALWIHAIGDRAVHEVVGAIAAARKAGQVDMPHRVEHVQCARPADIRKMARHGIIASVQPCHIMGDIRTAERYWPRLTRNTYAFHSMLEAGITLAMGSDVPVESNDPRLSLFGAVCRTEFEGYPDGGWNPEQRLSIEQVLQGFTTGAAAAVGDVALAGTLAPGAPADLTVWHDDPFAARPEELLNLRIAGCVIDGRPRLGDAE